MNAYFDSCAQEGTFPDEAGLILRLGISKDMYDRYARAELRRYRPFALCLERARLRRESILVRDIYAAEKRTPTAKMFLAKQGGNGGLCDRPKKDGDIGAKAGGEKPVLEVKMSGPGKDYFD